MTQHDAARTYTLTKQHLEGPPTLYRIVIRLDGSIAQYHYPGMSTEWSPDYPLNRDDAAEELRHWRRFVQREGGYQLTRQGCTRLSRWVRIETAADKE
jgi:hypothetical protein